MVSFGQEQIVRPIIAMEHSEARIMNFAKTDLKSQKQRQMLTAIFVNNVHVYDDKIVVLFNYKDGECIRIDDIKMNIKREHSEI